MNSHPRSVNGMCKSATLLVAALALLAPANLARADNGNSPGHGDPHVFRVVDKHGKFVGYSLSENLVAREINGTWVTFHARRSDAVLPDRRSDNQSSLPASRFR